jgi:cytochrome c553
MSLSRTLLRLGVAAVLAASANAGARAAASQWDWAFPAAGAEASASPNPVRVVTLPGSRARYTRSEIESGFTAIDWWPTTHPALPPIVKYGRKPDVLACGYCHLPDGNGRPENAAIAGLPAAYITAQVHDIRFGRRTSVHPAWLPSAVMDQVAHAATTAEVAAAAAYFSQLHATARTRVIETAEIPAVAGSAFVYRRKAGTAREPLGERIVETPADFDRFSIRDSTVSYLAYVPPGAVARGRELAAKGDREHVTACERCHGAGLRGAGAIPPLAGRSPTQLFRQLAGFQTGTRHGPAAALMHAETAHLSASDLIAAAAYAATLKP